MTIEQIKEYFTTHYGKDMTAKEISQELNVPVTSVYRTAKKLHLTSKLNPEFQITPEQEQIILGGILGDGSFKKNGSNYYYREVHSIKEKDYMIWKYNKLYNLTTKKTYHIPKRTENQNEQIGIQTKNSPSLFPYATMDIDNVIDAIKELGLLIWILDDGWIRRNSKKCSLAVSSGLLSLDQLNRVLKKLNEYNLDGRMIGSRCDISLGSQNNKRIKEMMYKYFSPDMDIMIKKINDLQG